MTDRAKQILEMWWDGLFTTTEALTKLDAIQIRGGFDGPAFTGYDYANQVWVEFSR